MANQFHSLPPHKRYHLINQPKSTSNSPHSSILPAKKRKQTLDSPPIGKNLETPVSAATATVCLPAKKRICALHPNAILNKPFSSFDLNLEYDPKSDQENDKKHVLDKDFDQENEWEDEDGILCCVCQSTDGDPQDPIVLCDGCDLMVHTTCYGNPLVTNVPDGDWFCAKCETSEKTRISSLTCCMCPVKTGALKPTVDGRWAHIVCVLFIPEVFFSDPEGREGIDCSKVVERRWGGKCYVCRKSSGCVIDCSEEKCGLRFHVSCGLSEDLCFEYKEGRNKGAIVAGFCRSHTDLWMKQQATGKYKIVARNE
ncbi:nuA3 HAT complex component NTO1-like [Bidens hawaiensis]|uniref:nuA3 HAT complex component NTO1-like n=1 Tax=Bidens hawaiensis TaxID=980011 RepID=UPI00404A04E5